MDLDYKALSNAGTWFVGKLQTERDKARLLDGLQQEARSAAVHSDALLARFAAAMDAFGSSQGWWNRLLGLDATGGLDLKKEGVFPVVHGVRSLALQAQLSETARRVQRVMIFCVKKRRC